MFPLTPISKRITRLFIQPYLPQIRKRLPVGQQNNESLVIPDQMIYSGWQYLEFEKKESYWKAYLVAPEISRYILNHAEVLFYYWKGNVISKVTHYTDEDFWKNLLWTDHCVLLQKILLFSNYDASALYRYVIIPKERKVDIPSSPPDHKDHQTV